MRESTFILHRGEGEVPKKCLIAPRDFFSGPEYCFHTVEIEIFERRFKQEAAVVISFERYGTPLPHYRDTVVRVRAVAHCVAEATEKVDAGGLDVFQNGLERWQIPVNVRYDRYAHAQATINHF